MSPATTRAAIQHLRAVDPVIERVIERVGPYRLSRRGHGSHFEAVARAIVGQQLSTAAAQTIWTRFLGLYGGDTPEPGAVLATTAGALRGVGLSGQKLAYLRDLAGRVEEGTLPLHRIARLPDQRVIEALTEVKGIGVWTAQMFLMFRLARPDVLPDGDLGIRKGVQRAYRLRALPEPERVRRIGRRWSPYASVASWYLWRLLELPE